MRHLPGPVFIVGGALFDPFGEDSGVRFGEVLLGIDGRHTLFAIPGGDAVDHFALVEITGDNGGAAEDLGVGALGGVETQVGLAGFLVGTMAFEAVIRENRHHIAAKIDLGLRSGERGDNEKAGGSREKTTHAGQGGSSNRWSESTIDAKLLCKI